jgi:ferrous iron transport protein A
MRLSELKKGQKGVIKSILADPELKQRLYSFGIIRGEEIEVKGYSLAKQTIEIDVDGTLIALRREEAEKIEVEEVENEIKVVS